MDVSLSMCSCRVWRGHLPGCMLARGGVSGYSALEIAVEPQVDGGAPHLVGNLLAVPGFG